jgi:hypothetical protein
MRFMTLSALASSWLVISPALWAHRPAKAIAAVAVGVFAMLMSPLGVAWTPARRWIAAAGALLALSNFVLFDNLGVLASHSTVGLMLVFAGLAPQPKAQAVDSVGFA